MAKKRFLTRRQDVPNTSQNTCNNGKKKQNKTNKLWQNQYIQIDDYFDKTGECDDADIFFHEME